MSTYLWWWLDVSPNTVGLLFVSCGLVSDGGGGGGSVVLGLWRGAQDWLPEGRESAFAKSCCCIGVVVVVMGVWR